MLDENHENHEMIEFVIIIRVQMKFYSNAQLYNPAPIKKHAAQLKHN
jgi:hypothetical protein